jgi:hypothetical protein
MDPKRAILASRPRASYAVENHSLPARSGVVLGRGHATLSPLRRQKERCSDEEFTNRESPHGGQISTYDRLGGGVRVQEGIKYGVYVDEPKLENVGGG